MSQTTNVATPVQVTVRRLVRLFKKRDGGVTQVDPFLSPGETVTVGASQTLQHNGWDRKFVSVTSNLHTDSDLLASFSELEAAQ